MAGNNVSSISVVKPGANGAVFWAPVGTTGPTSASETKDAAFKSVGYLSSDGIERGDGYEEGEGKEAFGGDTVVKGVGKMKPFIKFTLWQTGDPDALALAYHTSDITGVLNDFGLKNTNKTPTDKALIVEFVRSPEIVEVYYIPKAVFATREDVKNDNDSVDGIGVQYSILPDEDGVYWYRYVGAVV